MQLIGCSNIRSASFCYGWSCPSFSTVQTTDAPGGVENEEGESLLSECLLTCAGCLLAHTRPYEVDYSDGSMKHWVQWRRQLSARSTLQQVDADTVFQVSSQQKESTMAWLRNCRVFLSHNRPAGLAPALELFWSALFDHEEHSTGGTVRNESQRQWSCWKGGRADSPKVTTQWAELGNQCIRLRTRVSVTLSCHALLHIWRSLFVRLSGLMKVAETGRGLMKPCYHCLVSLCISLREK